MSTMILVVDAAELAQGGEVALRQEIEMLDQRLHRGIVAVELAQLDREAFAQIARTNAGRIECLQHREHGVDVCLRAPSRSAAWPRSGGR